MATLTPEQCAAVDKAIGQDGYARLENYVVLRADVYDRLRTLLEDGPDVSQVASLVETAMRDQDADDPLLESYQSYRS
jgi:hypothetical protein